MKNTQTVTFCEVSLQMTELTNSSRGAVGAGNRGRGPRCSRYVERAQRFIRLIIPVVGRSLTGQRVSAPEITAALGENLRPELFPGTGVVGTSGKTTGMTP